MEIAVISGKGGTGKSSLSAAFATAGDKVVLADCDVDAANLYLLFNPSHEDEEVYVSGHKATVDSSKCTNCELCIDYCRFDAISPGENTVIISDLSCEGCFLCSRICPENAINMIPDDNSRMYSGSFRNGKMVYGRLAPGEENSGKLVNMVREKAKNIAKENGIGNIILDGPPGIGCPAISTITGVDKVIIITEPTISGLHDLQRATGIVTQSGRKPLIIINKWDLNPSLTEQIKKWCSDNNFKVEGILKFEPAFVESMVKGKSIIEHNPDNNVNKEIKRIWKNILNNKL